MGYIDFENDITEIMETLANMPLLFHIAVIVIFVVHLIAIIKGVKRLNKGKANTV